MNKEQQDLAWGCLPKEVRNHIRSDYEYYLKRYEAVNSNTSKGAIDALEDLFGKHNLLSDTEPEEMLMVERKKVIKVFNKLHKDSYIAADLQLGLNAFRELFGDKCLPDKEGIDCNKLNQMLDEALEKETPESIKEWLDNKGTMEEKELNLCELLKGCEEEEFYCPYLRKNVKFIGFDEHDGMTFILSLYKDGLVYENLMYIKKNEKIGKSFVLCPSEELYEKYPLDAYSAWMEWKEEGDKPTLTVTIDVIDKVNILGSTSSETFTFSSYKEAQQAAEAVKEALQKFRQTPEQIMFNE